MQNLRLIAIGMITSAILLSVACSKSEQPAEVAAPAYMSENQQFVEQLNNDVTLEDPAALLAELNTPELNQPTVEASVSDAPAPDAPVPTMPEVAAAPEVAAPEQVQR